MVTLHSQYFCEYLLGVKAQCWVRGVLSEQDESPRSLVVEININANNCNSSEKERYRYMFLEEVVRIFATGSGVCCLCLVDQGRKE